MPHAEHLPADIKVLHPATPPRYVFSICTLVTRPDQYADMVASFRQSGFDADCEFLCIDNSQSNIYDAFSGYNAFLVEAQGKYVILSHQDVLLSFDDRQVLERKLDELSVIDSSWGVCGNSGGIAFGKHSIRISDPHGENISAGEFPQRVFSLDENFIVARRDANLSLSNDLSGYHMYGSDMCVMADVKGLNCYVIDFHLRHLSGGKLDASFWASVVAFGDKYARAFRSRWLQSPITPVFLSDDRLLRATATSRIGRRLGIAKNRG